jgi:hypothetical protein
MTPTKVPTITWRPVSDAATGGSAITSYRVYRDGVFVGEATTPAYTDGKLVLSGQYVYSVRSIDAAGNISAMSAGREVILDADGPILDAISFPSKTTAGTPVAFSVAPRDVHTAVQGEASWDFGDGTAVGNSTKHVFEAPGRYAITIRATDALGNVTTVGNRTIQVAAPKGGMRPKEVKLGKLRSMSIKLVRRAKWKLRAYVTVDLDARVQFLLLRRGVMVSSTTRMVPAGGVTVHVVLPKALRRPGKYQLVARSVLADREAKQTFTLKK